MKNTETQSRPSQQQMVRAHLKAAEKLDWLQVVLNGGPPCFHLEDDGGFCGRAQKWAGHDVSHKFVSLADLLRLMRPNDKLTQDARR